MAPSFTLECSGLDEQFCGHLTSGLYPSTWHMSRLNKCVNCCEEYIRAVSYPIPWGLSALPFSPVWRYLVVFFPPEELQKDLLPLSF